MNLLQGEIRAIRGINRIQRQILPRFWYRGQVVKGKPLCKRLYPRRSLQSYKTVNVKARRPGRVSWSKAQHG